MARNSRPHGGASFWDVEQPHCGGSNDRPAEAVTDRFTFREQELLKDPSGHATTHDKVAVIDPCAPRCMVGTGSHNLCSAGGGPHTLTGAVKV